MTEIGIVDQICVQIRRELIVVKYDRMEAGHVSTSDRSLESGSPASYQKLQDMHCRNASVEQLSEAQLGILDAACAKMRQSLVASRYERLNGELLVAFDGPVHASSSSGTYCGTVARNVRDPIAQQLSDVELDIKDPVYAQMRLELIASRYTRLNNGLSVSGVTFSSVE